MIPLAEAKPHFALVLLYQPRKFILSFALVLAGWAILAPVAEGQVRGNASAMVVVERSDDGRRDHPATVGHCMEVPHSAEEQVQISDAGNSNPCSPDSGSSGCNKERTAECAQDQATNLRNQPASDSGIQPSEKKSRHAQLPDFNREIYYRNKLEFALDGGWHPINIPFPFNALEGDPYSLYPLRYTLVPIIASLRWHLDSIKGPIILRGNWDLTAGLSATAIPRGPESHYFSYNMSVRRNFVPRNWHVAPYWDIRLGLGYINAKGPLGVYYAQGQNFTFNMNMGSGFRYNFNPRYSIAAGLNYMHISNFNLSAPEYSNYGINVYGPMFGLNIRLGKHGPRPDQE